jgi:ribosomal protein L11 methyltransferase
MAFELLISFNVPDLSDAARLKASVLKWFESRGRFDVVDGIIDGIEIPLTEEEFARAETKDDRFASAPLAVFDLEKTVCEQILLELIQEFGEGIKGRITEILDESWQSCWQESFDKFQSEKFFFVPHGSLIATPTDRIRVELINRNGAFGTGQHATTRAVVKALEYLIQSRSPRSMLDVGTGTGVYLIVAWLMGLKELAATEIDEDLINVARENCDKAGVTADIRLADKPKFDRKFDLIVANILTPVLHSVMSDMVSHLSLDGYLVLAGFVDKEEGLIVQEALGHGLTLDYKISEAGWNCLVFIF